MKQNILTWVPIFIFILFVLIVKRYFYNFHSYYVDILEKAIAVLIVLSYGYKSISMGIISVMIMLVFYTLLIEKLEGFTIGDKISDLLDASHKKIPKRIIQLWKTWSDKKPEMFSVYVQSLKEKNPEYDYMFFKDEQIDEFLQSYYPHYYETYMKLPMNIQKVDFCRYVILYHFGGFYFDLDIQALEPLDELIENECVFPIDEIIHRNMCSSKRFNNFCRNKVDFLLGQYGFGCCPKNRFVKLLVDVIHKNVDNYIASYVANSEDYVYATTGPDFVTSLYMNYPDKESINILYYDKRQYFGKYAKHNFIGTWKTPGNQGSK